ncbi:hypothetical protein Tco_0348226 [Tanacetum coccineum]
MNWLLILKLTLPPISCLTTPGAWLSRDNAKYCSMVRVLMSTPAIVPAETNNIYQSHADTRNKGKKIVKAPSPPPESDHEQDSDEEETQRDKEIQRALVR